MFIYVFNIIKKRKNTISNIYYWIISKHARLIKYHNLEQSYNR